MYEKLKWWMLGALLSVLLAVSSGLFAAYTSQLADHGTRLARVNVRVTEELNNKLGVSEFERFLLVQNARLDQIDAKLTQLLLRAGGGKDGG